MARHNRPNRLALLGRRSRCILYPAARCRCFVCQASRWVLDGPWPLQVPKLARVALVARGKRIHKAGWKASLREALFPGAPVLEQLAQAQLSSVTRYTAAVGRTSLEARGQVQWSGWCKPQEGEGPASLDACSNSPKRPPAAHQVGWWHRGCSTAPTRETWTLQGVPRNAESLPYSKASWPKEGTILTHWFWEKRQGSA